MSIKYTYVGHGTHMLDVNGTKIVIDPFFTNNPGTDLTPNDVEADYILVSHGHFDHVDDLLSLATLTKATVISNFEIASWLGSQGVPEEQRHAQHIGGGFNHSFGYVKLTIAHHGSMLPDGSSGGNPAGFLISTDGKKLYFACDTGLFSTMKLYGDEGLDLAVLPIGDNFTMGPDDALRAVKLLNPKVVVPSHYNTWPPITQDADAWKRSVEAETDSKVTILEPGESMEL